MPSLEECQKYIFNCAIKYGVSPKLIGARLLSDLDKKDMLDGKVGIASLESFVEVWRDNGMPDYAHGKTESYESEKKRILYEEKIRDKNDGKSEDGYRKPFVTYRTTD